MASQFGNLPSTCSGCICRWMGDKKLYNCECKEECGKSEFQIMSSGRRRPEGYYSPIRELFALLSDVYH